MNVGRDNRGATGLGGLTLAPSTLGPSFDLPLAKQYGMPLPLVWGTARVPGKVLWLGAVTQVNDIQVRGKVKNPDGTDSGFDGWNTAPGSVAPALVGLCEGPIAAGTISAVRRSWAGGDGVPFLSTLSRKDAAATTLLGDGTEGPWTLKEALTARDESYSLASEATSFKVPDPSTISANLGATWQLGIDWQGMTLVGSAPGFGQYTYAAGVYGFPGGGSNIHPKMVKVRRNLTALPGGLYPMAPPRTRGSTRAAPVLSPR